MPDPQQLSATIKDNNQVKDDDAAIDHLINELGKFESEPDDEGEAVSELQIMPIKRIWNT